MNLYERFNTNTGRMIHKLDHYFPIYERHFARHVGRPVTMIEIGVGRGGSLAMWRDWLGPQATIVGLDNRTVCFDYEAEQIHVWIGDQADHQFLATVVREFGNPDIVLDDGSHLGRDQIASFEFLYPRLAPDGVYMVEDLHCAYLREFEGGPGLAGTFVEFCKPKLDEINGEPATLDFANITASMHFYDSIAVFERGAPPRPRRWRRVPEPE